MSTWNHNDLWFAEKCTRVLKIPLFMNADSRNPKSSSCCAPNTTDMDGWTLNMRGWRLSANSYTAKFKTTRCWMRRAANRRAASISPPQPFEEGKRQRARCSAGLENVSCCADWSTRRWGNAACAVVRSSARGEMVSVWHTGTNTQTHNVTTNTRNHFPSHYPPQATRHSPLPSPAANRVLGFPLFHCTHHTHGCSSVACCVPRPTARVFAVNLSDFAREHVIHLCVHCAHEPRLLLLGLLLSASINQGVFETA